MVSLNVPESSIALVPSETEWSTELLKYTLMSPDDADPVAYKSAEENAVSCPDIEYSRYEKR